MNKITLSILPLLLLILLGCSPAGPVPIQFGIDECSHCRMTLTDQRFGAEVVTHKGKAYKFDDLRCLTGFAKEGSVPATEIAGYYVVDFSSSNGTLVDATKAFYLNAEALNSPMAGNVAGFANAGSRDEVQKQLKGKALDWAQVKP